MKTPSFTTLPEHTGISVICHLLWIAGGITFLGEKTRINLIRNGLITSPGPNGPTQLTVLLEALGSLQEDQVRVGFQIKKIILVKIGGLF